MRWEKVLCSGNGGAGKRWGHTCNAVRGGKLLYVFGGYGQDNLQTNKVHVFHSVNRTWTEPDVSGTPPVPRDSHTCTTVRDRLFVFGGTNERNPLNDLHILDTASNTWSSPTVSGDCPEAREGHGAALIGKQLFIFGGCGKYEDEDIYYDDVFILNTETYVWKRATTSGTPPTRRDGHSCSSYKNKIVVIGGEDYSNRYSSDVHILDTDTLMWCKLNTTGELLPPRAGHATVSFGKNLLVVGGYYHEQHLYDDDIYVLNIETAIWTKVSVTGESPFTRFSMPGECLDPQMEGVVVFFGGCDKNLEALDDIYLLHTGLVREIDRGLSLRKQIKLKYQEQYTPASASNQTLVDGGNNANIHHGIHVSNFEQPGNQFDLNEAPPPEERISFKGKVTETLQDGFFFETVVEGTPRRLFFSKNPNFNMLPGETSNSAM